MSTSEKFPRRARSAHCLVMILVLLLLNRVPPIQDFPASLIVKPQLIYFLNKLDSYKKKTLRYLLHAPFRVSLSLRWLRRPAARNIYASANLSLPHG